MATIDQQIAAKEAKITKVEGDIAKVEQEIADEKLKTEGPKKETNLERLWDDKKQLRGLLNLLEEQLTKLLDIKAKAQAPAAPAVDLRKFFSKEFSKMMREIRSMRAPPLPLYVAGAKFAKKPLHFDSAVVEYYQRPPLEADSSVYPRPPREGMALCMLTGVSFAISEDKTGDMVQQLCPPTVSDQQLNTLDLPRSLLDSPRNGLVLLPSVWKALRDHRACFFCDPLGRKEIHFLILDPNLAEEELPEAKQTFGDWSGKGLLYPAEKPPFIRVLNYIARDAHMHALNQLWIPADKVLLLRDFADLSDKAQSLSGSAVSSKSGSGVSSASSPTKVKSKAKIGKRSDSAQPSLALYAALDGLPRQYDFDGVDESEASGGRSLDGRSKSVPASSAPSDSGIGTSSSPPSPPKEQQAASSSSAQPEADGQ